MSIITTSSTSSTIIASQNGEQQSHMFTLSRNPHSARAFCVRICFAGAQILCECEFPRAHEQFTDARKCFYDARHANARILVKRSSERHASTPHTSSLMNYAVPSVLLLWSDGMGRKTRLYNRHVRGSHIVSYAASAFIFANIRNSRWLVPTPT